MVTKRTAARATTRKPAAAKPATEKRKTTAAKPRAKATRGGNHGGKAISAEQRQRMIEEAAYYEAERHGFTPGNAMNDWLAAETKIDNILNK